MNGSKRVLASLDTELITLDEFRNKHLDPIIMAAAECFGSNIHNVDPNIAVFRLFHLIFTTLGKDFLALVIARTNERMTEANVRKIRDEDELVLYVYTALLLCEQNGSLENRFKAVVKEVDNAMGIERLRRLLNSLHVHTKRASDPRIGRLTTKMVVI